MKAPAFCCLRSALLWAGSAGLAASGAAIVASLSPSRFEGGPVTGRPVHIPSRTGLVEASRRLADSPLHPRGSLHAGHRPRLECGRFRSLDPTGRGTLLEERAGTPFSPLDVPRRDVTERAIRAWFIVQSRPLQAGRPLLPVQPLKGCWPLNAPTGRRFIVVTTGAALLDLRQPDHWRPLGSLRPVAWIPALGLTGSPVPIQALALDLDPWPVQPRLARKDLIRIELWSRGTTKGSPGPDLFLIAITPVGTPCCLVGIRPDRARTFLPVADQRDPTRRKALRPHPRRLAGTNIPAVAWPPRID